MTDNPPSPPPLEGVQTLDWYAVGDAREVVLAEAKVAIKVISLRGRRVRISIFAPNGTRFIEILSE